MSDRILITKGNPKMNIPIEDFSGQEITNPSWVYHYEGLPLLKSYVRKRFGDVPLEVVEEDGNTYLQPKVYELVVQTIPESQTLYSKYIQPYVQKVTSHPDFQALFGGLRINTVRNHPEGVKVFRDANNFVGNTMIEIATAPWMLSNVATVGNLISAGEWGTLAAGLAGGYIGHEAANEVSVNLTGKTIEENLQRNGINAYNSAILHPGSIGGSYIGSKLYSGITNNAYSWLFNNLGGTAVSGPLGAVEVPIGELYAFPTTITQNIGYSRNIGVPHKGTYGNHVVASGGKAAHTGKSTRLGYKPELLVISSKSTNTDYYTNPEEPYLPTLSVIFPMGTIYNPPVVPPAIQVPLVRFVETAPAVSDWEIWFGKQPENTILWYYGTDPNHKPGPYLIKRSGVFGHERTRVGLHEGYVAPDSTTTRVVPYIPQYKVVKKEGAVSPEAEIDYNLKIRIEDADE